MTARHYRRSRYPTMAAGSPTCAAALPTTRVRCPIRARCGYHHSSRFGWSNRSALPPRILPPPAVPWPPLRNALPPVASHGSRRTPDRCYGCPRAASRALHFPQMRPVHWEWCSSCCPAPPTRCASRLTAVESPTNAHPISRSMTLPPRRHGPWPGPPKPSIRIPPGPPTEGTSHFDASTVVNPTPSPVSQSLSWQKHPGQSGWPIRRTTRRIKCGAPIPGWVPPTMRSTKMRPMQVVKVTNFYGPTTAISPSRGNTMAGAIFMRFRPRAALRVC